MDVDGTLTDGKIYMTNQGELFKAFSIKDGCGIHDLLIPKGIVPIILTGRESKIVYNRCKELGIYHIFQGVSNKAAKLQSIINDLSEAAYIGDDINDLECMKMIKESHGIIACPKNASKNIKEICDFVSSKNGGDGAVREFIEWILNDIHTL